MGRAFTKRWTMLDASRQNSLYSNAWIHRPRELFHNSLLATKTHRLELFFPPQKYRIPKTLIQSRRSRETTSPKKSHPLYWCSILPQNTTSEKVSQKSPNIKDKKASKKRPKQQSNRMFGKQTPELGNHHQPLPHRRNSPKNSNKKISTKV